LNRLQFFFSCQDESSEKKGRRGHTLAPRTAASHHRADDASLDLGIGDELGCEGGPAGLVAGAQAAPRLAVEMLWEDEGRVEN
jgi:hypothetical protein